MATKHINFTKKALEALPAPTKSVRAYYHDTKEVGLSVSVTPAGTKTFFVHKKIDGADERITLGRFPDLSIENARKLFSPTFRFSSLFCIMPPFALGWTEDMKRLFLWFIKWIMKSKLNSSFIGKEVPLCTYLKNHSEEITYE